MRNTLEVCSSVPACSAMTWAISVFACPRLVTATPAEYEARAIELANDANQLQALRQRLQANRASSPLFNATLFARHIEAAYLAMDERQLQGLPPQAIEITGRTGA